MPAFFSCLHFLNERSFNPANNFLDVDMIDIILKRMDDINHRNGDIPHDRYLTFRYSSWEESCTCFIESSSYVFWG